MSIGYVKRVTFLCPTVITGGPEAIHQARQVLDEQGLQADIAYYGPGGTIQVDDGQALFGPPDVNPCTSVYANYRPVATERILLRRHHLVVLPEPLAAHAPMFGRASVAVWWLSVDNGLPGLDALARRAFFADTAVKHFHQSAYAEDFLRRHGVEASYPLADYTDPEFTSVVPEAPNPDAVVAHNPAKGGDLSGAFFAAHPELRELPLRGLSKSDMAATLRRTRVYVDFGHLPGKDRMPREAAASGAVVFVRKRGAGLFRADFPIPDFFRFDEDDVASGELFRRVAAVQADPASFWDQQEDFRAGIRAEHEDFRDQVRALRGQRRAA